MNSVQSATGLPALHPSDLGRQAHLDVGLGRAALALSRYGLVLILLYFGAFKFTAIEAHGIEPLVRHSPFFGWSYELISVQAVSNVFGVGELAIALLMVARRWSAKACAWGSLGAVVMFLVTLSFLFTTPGLWLSVPGFALPVPNELGSFVVKDVFLLGAALLIAAEAWGAARQGKAAPRAHGAGEPSPSAVGGPLANAS